MTNAEWVARTGKVSSRPGQYVDYVAQEIERPPTIPFRMPVRDTAKKFTCPACGQEKRFNACRSVRHPSDGSIKICQKCYGLGPTAVFQNIARRQAESEKSN